MIKFLRSAIDLLATVVCPEALLLLAISAFPAFIGIANAQTITAFPINSIVFSGGFGALWFPDTAKDQVGRILTASSSATPLVAAVLPSSRPVEIGNTTTAFATTINSGSIYQTTSRTISAPTGPPNTPANIAAGASQSFVIALTPNAPVAPTEVALGVSCTGVNAAPSTTGLNTLLYSASATSMPDVVGRAATAQNDGILHITGTTGPNAFAVATVNVGAGGSITATANTGVVTLPLAISLCQTDPASSQCMSSISPNVTTTMNASATPTFALLAAASGQVPFVPQTNRIFVEFSDASGTVRGSTSVAVETQ